MKKPIGVRKRNRMLRLWHADPCCHWCRRLTVLVFRPEGIGMRQVPRADNEATIDHLNDRYSGRPQIHGVELTVLACHRCNQKRADEATAAIPIEELRLRSKRGIIASSPQQEVRHESDHSGPQKKGRQSFEGQPLDKRQRHDGR